MAGLAPPERNVSVRFRPYPPMKNLILPKNLISKIYPLAKALNGLINRGEKPIRILYGETYDQYGITIDSLKYYFFLAILSNKLKGLGINSESVVLIADRASILNKSATDKVGLVNEGKKRLEQCQSISQKYNLQIKFQLMSEYVRSKFYLWANKRQKGFEFAKKDSFTK